MPSPAVISVLARSMAAGEPDIEGVYERGVRTLGRPWGWLRSLARRYVEAFAGKTRPRHRDVVQFLFHDAEFQRASRKSRNEISIAEWTPEPQRMQPVAAAGSWSVPAIESARALADWLCLGIAELEWLADLKGLGCKLHRPKLEHYHYVVAPKRSGGIRLTERPSRV